MSQPTEEESERRRALKIARWMIDQGSFARLLGLEVVEAAPGYCLAALTVRADMLNPLKTTHGGITFTLADFAFGVACNSHGMATFGLSTTISYPAISREGDRLTAEAREESRGRRTGLYRVEVRRDDGTLVGLFMGTSYSTGEPVDKWMEKQEGAMVSTTPSGVVSAEPNPANR
ncbi:MAG: hotdog fold thioesterase [Magnetococcales bacterium]|nr:hotdog fold thioesterase [Magnetococcales bacterium]MBF0156461.1 hotdog fold thioesterase [Magnetococcales bacterium]CAX84128.1 Phenylacetic acid degradation protein PaaD [uncultured bacterium]